MTALFCILALAVFMVGCGEESAPTEAEVRAALQVAGDGSMPVAITQTCEVVAVLTTSDAIQFYRDSGEEVVTNPSGNVGAQVEGNDSDLPLCQSAAEGRLSRFE